MNWAKVVQDTFTFLSFAQKHENPLLHKHTNAYCKIQWQVSELAVPQLLNSENITREVAQAARMQYKS